MIKAVKRMESRHHKAKASEKKSTESLGLIKNRQAPKTFNKDKKVVWGKECLSNSSSRIYINKKA
jgi:hypothetical protein